MNKGQWRGLLFEEIVLELLCRAGFRRLTRYDKSIRDDGGNGLKVLGRGAWHQADSIVEFPFTPAFTFPLRLIAEAKAYTEKIGLDVVRNAVGVVKDVLEVWDRADASDAAAHKFTYAYTVFSLSDFTDPATDYAFVQGIGLVSLKGHPWAKLSKAIKRTNFAGLKGATPMLVREEIREALSNYGDNGKIKGFLDVKEAMAEIPFLLVGMLRGGLPLILVPAKDLRLEDLRDPIRVRIRQQRGNWFIESSDRLPLFRFSMPERLLRNYSDKEKLQRYRMKSEHFDEINVMFYAAGPGTSRRGPRAVRLIIDEEWLQDLKVGTPGLIRNKLREVDA